jgi:uncharacterized protein
MKRVAVVGGGIAGIAAADVLGRWADVTLFEAADRLGGHTDTHELTVGGTEVAIDSGFIVFNRRNYPQFSDWLDGLGVASHATDMSFSVRRGDDGFEYGTDSFAALAAQPCNLVRPRFLRMWRDLLHFYRVAPLTPARSGERLRDYCARLGLSAAFVDDHLLPMCAALWSQPLEPARDLDMSLVLAFMANHGMLSLADRPAWRVVTGGSQRYVDAFRNRFRGVLRPGAAVGGVSSDALGVTLRVDGAAARFDAVVLACHANQALALLERATPAQRTVLGALRYQPNHVLIHTDAALLPRRKRAWSSWNVRIDAAAGGCRVTYWMNRLQRVATPQPVFVSLNAAGEVRDECVLAERRYAHPVFDTRAVAAQAELPTLQGVGHVYLAGAYARWGFHEDGFVAGRTAAARLAEQEGMRHVA